MRVPAAGSRVSCRRSRQQCLRELNRISNVFVDASTSSFLPFLQNHAPAAAICGAGSEGFAEQESEMSAKVQDERIVVAKNRESLLTTTTANRDDIAVAREGMLEVRLKDSQEPSIVVQMETSSTWAPSPADDDIKFIAVPALKIVVTPSIDAVAQDNGPGGAVCSGQENQKTTQEHRTRHFLIRRTSTAGSAHNILCADSAVDVNKACGKAALKELINCNLDVKERSKRPVSVGFSSSLGKPPAKNRRATSSTCGSTRSDAQPARVDKSYEAVFIPQGPSTPSALSSTEVTQTIGAVIISGSTAEAVPPSVGRASLDKENTPTSSTQNGRINRRSPRRASMALSPVRPFLDLGKSFRAIEATATFSTVSHSMCPDETAYSGGKDDSPAKKEGIGKKRCFTRRASIGVVSTISPAVPLKIIEAASPKKGGRSLDTSAENCTGLSPSGQVGDPTRENQRRRRSTRRSSMGAPGKVLNVSTRSKPSRTNLSSSGASTELPAKSESYCYFDTGAKTNPEKGERMGSIAALAEKFMIKAEGEGSAADPDRVLLLLRSLVVALVDAESCVTKHERNARVPENQGVQMGRKEVRFCSFDFSTVDMPLDTADGSDLSAEEVVQCLQGVIDAKTLLGEALQSSDGYGNGVAIWKAFLRELRASVDTEVERGARRRCLATGKPTGKIRQKHGGNVIAEARSHTRGAAWFLWNELEQVESIEVPAQSVLRERLANILSSLVRFKLRTLLNPPPERLSTDDSYVSDRKRFSGRTSGSARPTHFSKVHQVVEIELETPKRSPSKSHPFDDTRDAPLNAAFARALRRLYGYSSERALEVIVVAEMFLGSKRGKIYKEADIVYARQLLILTADAVDAIKARRFVRSLLELEEVKDAIVENGGWVGVERLASALKALKTPTDINTPFTLLSDVRGLMTWLGSESSWKHGKRAEEALRQLLALLMPLSETRRRSMEREAYQLICEDIIDVRSRFRFPIIKKAQMNKGEALTVEPDVKVDDEIGEKNILAATPKKSGRKKRKSTDAKHLAASLVADKMVAPINTSDFVGAPTPQKPSRRKRRASIM